MRLKQIKPKMAILCENKEQGAAVVEQLLKQGATWDCFHSANYSDENNKCYLSSNMTFNFYGDYIANTKFSDLVLLELSAEEALKICNEICKTHNCEGCPMERNCFLGENADYEKIITICSQWKADHEKKELETEWFWQGRIFKVDRGLFYQINDGTGIYDTGCEYQESAEEYMADELKEYCKTHEGEYIATVEHVCRVVK